ncbi:MAG: hypothetical protein ACYTEP_01190 [Planctomycetota bacterium]|jgi:hypothetical protein
MKTLLTPACALLCALPLSAQGSEVDDFEGGLNNANWTFGVIPADVIEPTGGSPNGWLHNSQIDMFTAILQSDTTTGPWVGDYRATGVSRIHLDAQTLGAVFGAGGRQMSILLRDTKGTPDVNDDDYAYSKGPLVPQIGDGWSHYNFEIPSQSTDAVPQGWVGGWVGGGQSFRPGIDWNDVITSVDVVEIWWMDPSLFAIFQTWDVGVDNLTIEWGSDAEVTLSPGTAGVNNTLSMVNASAGGQVLFAASQTQGFTAFRCNQVLTGFSLLGPRNLGTFQADSLGTASRTLTIPSSMSGTTAFFQAIDMDDCRLAPLLSVTLQ